MEATQEQTNSTGTIAAPPEKPSFVVSQDAPAGLYTGADASVAQPGLSTRIDSLEATIADIKARLEHHGIVGR
jgi:hypothetical protein